MNRKLLSLLTLLGGLLLSLAPVVVHAVVVDAKLPSGKIGSANFNAGKKDQAAVLVLHGFLQTRTFPTVASIVDAVSTAGYTTLAPTLSLGISRRNKSLPCEAIHLHSLEQDTDEVAFWVNWLVKKGYSRIVLVGHSYGNVQLLSYMGRKPSPAVNQLLLISLTDVESKQSAQQRMRLVKDLNSRLEKRESALVESEFGHCKKYISPPAPLLSYLSVSRDSILKGVVKAPVPAEVILGDKDDRMGPDWAEKLASRGIVVRLISGASHFFDNQYEFDLQEAVVLALRDKPRGQ